MNFTYVNPNHLSAVWGKVKPCIDEILQRVNKREQVEFWIPEDVYAAIKVGEAHLLMRDEGWIIFRIEADKYTGIRKFYVWMLYAYDNLVENFLALGESELVDIARQYQCELIEFRAIRTGWLKVAPELGYKTILHSFSKRI